MKYSLDQRLLSDKNYRRITNTQGNRTTQANETILKRSFLNVKLDSIRFDSIYIDSIQIDYIFYLRHFIQTVMDFNIIFMSDTTFYAVRLVFKKPRSNYKITFVQYFLQFK